MSVDTLLLAAVTDAAVNIGVQISILVLAFNSLGCLSRSGMAGLSGNPISKIWRLPTHLPL